MKHFVLLLLLSSSLFAEKTDESSLTQPESKTERSSVALKPLALEKEVDSLYVVGPGDYFDVYIEASYLTVQVAPDGTIGFEQVGILFVGGLPLFEAKKQIILFLAKRYQASECFVQLSQIRSFRATVYGAVDKPGQYTVDGGTRLSAFLRTAGGLLGTANTDSITLIRGNDTTVIQQNQSDSCFSLEKDPFVGGGDLVYVPFRNFEGAVVVLKAGNGSRAMKWDAKETVREYFRKSDLFLRDENQYTHFQVEHSKSGNWSHYELKDIDSLTLDPYDIVVASYQGASVFVGGSLANLGRLDYNPTFSPYEYIGSAGLLHISEGYGDVHVIRAQGGEEYVDPVKGIIYPGDVILVNRSIYENVKDVTMFLASLLGVFSSTLIIYFSLKN